MRTWLALAVMLFGACAAASDAESEARPLALLGGTIYTSPTEEPVRDGVVLVRDGVVSVVGGRASVKIPPHAEVLDCSGLTVTAGFWNSQVHFFEQRWENAAAIPAPRLARELRDMVTRHGFTSVFDTGSAWDNTRALRERIESGEVPGPRIRSTGEALLAPGAMPSAEALRAAGYMPFDAPEVTGAAQARAAVRALLGRGVDGIKVHLQPPRDGRPPMPQSAVRAAIEEARRARVPVFVHPDTGADVLVAVRAGADVVAHTTPASGPWDGAVLAAVRQEKPVALTPTLALWKARLRQPAALATALAQLRAWIDAGGTVLFGTDLGAGDHEIADEYALMAEASMSFRQILASLTTAPALLCGEAGRLGRIAPGLRADLVILQGDPTRDIRSLADVRYTLRDGKILYAGRP